ncbi:RIX1 domain-containing protein [Mycena kentingensis (nom. inval.)]|nr:RIX1 domain-containing protein [Mycena kentingensis (nom. inval.)]
MDSHPLKTLLHHHLASDASAVQHVPYTLASLTPAALLPSPHSSKWSARITSLLHAKTSDARWAGLCLAQKSALLSQPVMIESAQSWIAVALPLLAVRSLFLPRLNLMYLRTKRKESPPVLRAAIRLLRVIFTTATEMPEFQRQVATPNVAKFTVALISLVETCLDEELKILLLSTLTRIIPIYPTLHRPHQPALTALCFVYLNGNACKPPNAKLTTAASQLYAVLHLTGGKVGAANLWRKAVDDALDFGWTALSSIRTTFLADGRLPQVQSASEPITSVPLNLDRLRCCIVILGDLFSAPVHRLVQVPLGALVKFALALLTCSKEEKVETHLDPTTRMMESLATPRIWALSCDLITALANRQVFLGEAGPVHLTTLQSFGSHLTPSAPRIATCIAFQLEQELTPSERLPFLDALEALFSRCYTTHATLVVNRLAKTVLPCASSVLSQQEETPVVELESNGRSKKGKRVRDFEGDEVFKIRQVVCPTTVDGQIVLRAFAVLQLLLRNGGLSPALQSIVCRVCLSALLALAQMTPASLSPDVRLHALLSATIQKTCVEFASASVDGLSKSLGLIVSTCLAAGTLQHEIEYLLHPRLPPLLRTMPGIEALSLFRTEESEEESHLIKSFGLASVAPSAPPVVRAGSEPVTLLPKRQPTAPAAQPLAPAVEPPAALIFRPTPPAPKPPLKAPSPALKVGPAPAEAPTLPVPMDVEGDETNEDMPSIDLDSDSDSE